MSLSLLVPLYNEMNRVAKTVDTLGLEPMADLAYAFIIGLSGTSDGSLLENWLNESSDNVAGFNTFIEDPVKGAEIAVLVGPMQAVAASPTATNIMLGSTTFMQIAAGTPAAYSSILGNLSCWSSVFGNLVAKDVLLGNSTFTDALVTDYSAMDVLWANETERLSFLQYPGFTTSLASKHASGADALFTTPGSYNWTVPDNTYTVSVVAVGAGGAGYANTNGANGGGGGGLGWGNTIPVLPGEVIPIVVGAGAEGLNGGDSYFKSTALVAGFGGEKGKLNSTDPNDVSKGGSYQGQGGGRGGNGGFAQNASGGGGGAGGYSTDAKGKSGGNGSLLYKQRGEDGFGGGGGAGGNGDSAYISGSGGGVGLYGEGVSGFGGYGHDTSSAMNGQGGSGGQDGGSGYNVQAFGGDGGGGRFGGGAGSYDLSNGTPGAGGGGAVRIIINGAASKFPNTNVGSS